MSDNWFAGHNRTAESVPNPYGDGSCCGSAVSCAPVCGDPYPSSSFPSKRGSRSESYTPHRVEFTEKTLALPGRGCKTKDLTCERWLTARQNSSQLHRSKRLRQRGDTPCGPIQADDSPFRRTRQGTHRSIESTIEAPGKVFVHKCATPHASAEAACGNFVGRTTMNVTDNGTT